MGDLSKNFSRKEFACPCGCGFDDIDLGLVNNILQPIRDKFGPVHITSGCRCLLYNRTLKDKRGRRLSKDTSQHVLGKAADIKVHKEIRIADGLYDTTSIPPIEVWRFALLRLSIEASKELNKTFSGGGLGLYKNFVHIDVRDGRAVRWGRKR